MKHFLLTFFSIALLFSACKKYDDGPLFSLESKKKRVSNLWVIQKVYETPQNGSKTDKTADNWSYYTGYLMSIEKDGGYTITYSPMNISQYNESGLWSFNDKKTTITFANGNGNSSAIGNHWTILRLKEKELWMQTTNSNNTTIEAHFSPF